MAHLLKVNNPKKGGGKYIFFFFNNSLPSVSYLSYSKMCVSQIPGANMPIEVCLPSTTI